ncbi:MAG: hypothetical protein ACXWKC_21045 [Xanthobacteraceae bacterium]
MLRRRALFFSLPFQCGFYERNPVAIRNKVAKLLDVTDRPMDSNSNLPDAEEPAVAF